MENLVPRVKQVVVPISVWLSWQELTLEQRDRQANAYFRYGYYGIGPTDFSGFEKAMYLNYPPLIDSYLERYKTKGGKVGAPIGNKNASKNNSETIKTIQNNQNNNCFSENNQNNDLPIDTDKEKDIDTDTDADADKDSTLEGASSAASAANKNFSYTIGKTIFDPIAFLMDFWNFYAERKDYMKKIEVPTTNIKQLVTDRYNELLADCHNDPLEAKNMMAKAVENVANSSWFMLNVGKATVSWIFKDSTNFSKVLNGNFNDD